jgi:alkanesulfonate monooxygenase SsuD/methylene tetrahydromethanopterin reductase-like flavin-dependent oxidoreductase (luciferase family)
LANMAATVDIISNGRLDFGIGAGWNVQEHTMYDIPFYTTGERIRRMGEACEAIRLLWTEPVANFEGRYYHLRDALCNPKPVQKPYPPIVIGGGGEKLTLRMVARYANIWNCNTSTAEEFRHKSEVLDQHCAAIGRDPSTIERSVQWRVQPDDLEATRAALRAFIDAGANHLILNLVAPYPEGIVTRLAHEVAEPLKAEYE